MYLHDGNAFFLNKISARFSTVANAKRDLTGIQHENTNVGFFSTLRIECRD
jgi:hypothetical protein